MSFDRKNLGELRPEESEQRIPGIGGGDCVVDIEAGVVHVAISNACFYLDAGAHARRDRSHARTEHPLLLGSEPDHEAGDIDAGDWLVDPWGGLVYADFLNFPVYLLYRFVGVRDPNRKR